MLIGRDEISRLIPHAGTMCLLDSVVRWNADTIRCSATSHNDRDNPLRVAGRLPIMSGVEYASQAMALHGGLSGAVAQRPRMGYLASLRGVVCRTAYLDGIADDLLIDIEKLMDGGSQAVYHFTLGAADRELMRGRAAVVLEAEPT